MEVKEAINILKNRKNRECSIDEMFKQQEALELVLDTLEKIIYLIN